MAELSCSAVLNGAKEQYPVNKADEQMTLDWWRGGRHLRHQLYIFNYRRRRPNSSRGETKERSHKLKIRGKYEVYEIPVIWVRTRKSRNSSDNKNVAD